MAVLRLGTLRRSEGSVVGRNRWPLALRFLLGLLPLAIVVFLYEQLAQSRARPRVFPPVTDILGALGTILNGHAELGNAYDQILTTALRLIVAFLVSFVLGIAIGIAAGRNKLVFSFVENLVWIFMAVPSVVWVFIFLIALGLNPIVPPVAVAATVMPQFIVLVAEGAKSVPPDLVEMSRSYKTTTWQRLTGLFIPYLVPYIVAASRTSYATAVKIMLVAEAVGQPNGIGFEVEYWEGQLFMGPIIAWGIIMLALGILVDRFLFSPIERRVSAWKTKPVEDAGPPVEAALGGVA